MLPLILELLIGSMLVALGTSAVIVLVVHFINRESSPGLGKVLEMGLQFHIPNSDDLLPVPRVVCVHMRPDPFPGQAPCQISRTDIAGIL